MFVENDADHQVALEKTGFWGSQGAGCVIMARDTRRFLIPHRSMHVEQSGTWGTWGGAIDANESPASAAKREVEEESGYKGHIELVPLYIFVKGTFRYSNFLAIVDKEFAPKLDWETQGYKWVKFGEWPHPLHFGFKAILDDHQSMSIIQRHI